MDSLLTAYRQDAGVHVYVSKVKPTMKEKTKEGKEYYDSWFLLDGFKNEDATMQRQRWHRTLGILFDLNRTREL